MCETIDPLRSDSDQRQISLCNIKTSVIKGMNSIGR